eukprot:scaffold34666_cov94-Phaeocystis_antarctica.AAC.1
MRSSPRRSSVIAKIVANPFLRRCAKKACMKTSGLRGVPYNAATTRAKEAASRSEAAILMREAALPIRCPSSPSSAEKFAGSPETPPIGPVEAPRHARYRYPHDTLAKRPHPARTYLIFHLFNLINAPPRD